MARPNRQYDTGKNPDLLSIYEIVAWANIPREVLLSKIASAVTAFDEKVYALMILLSWCGPHISEVCVLKDGEGKIIRGMRDSLGSIRLDKDGPPIWARQFDFRDRLDLGPDRDDQVSRSFRRLHSAGWYTKDADGVIKPNLKPVAQARARVDRSANLRLAGLILELPSSPELKIAAEGFLTGIRSERRRRIHEIESHVQQQIRTGAEAVGIRVLRVGKTVNSAVDGSAKPPVTQVNSDGCEVGEIAEAPLAFSAKVGGAIIIEEEGRNTKADEEEGAPAAALDKPLPTYSDFRSYYPKERLDDAKARLAFIELPDFEKRHCFESLLNHLPCERWVRSLMEDGGQFIPLASNFITNKHYRGDPPPYIGPQLSPAELRNKKHAEQLAADAREIFERNLRRRKL